MTYPHTFRRGALLSAFILAGCAFSAPALADSLGELRGLVDQEQYQPAWDMAQRMDAENAGDPDFDFYYGVAALRAGKPQQALLALERVHMAQPTNPRVKAELARAHYETGNTGEARRLFDEVLAENPPAPVQQTVRTYLDAIEARDQARGVQVGGELRIALGHDSNINTVSDESLHFFPLFNTFGVLSTKSEDAAFMDTRASVQVTRPVNKRQVQFFNAAVHSRDNEDILSGGNYDLVDLSLGGGWLLERGATIYRIPVNVTGSAIESDEARYVTTLGAEMNRPLASNRALLGFVTLGEQHYPSFEQRDVWMAVLGGGMVWNLDSWRLVATAHVGTDPAQEDGFDMNGRDYFGARLGATWAMARGHALQAGVGMQMSEYQGNAPILLFAREETLMDASLGWRWQVSRTFDVTADVSYTDNDSDANTIYDYDRTQASVGAGWRF
jgi:tetratricopeptide (TPR) repeat protein